MKRSLYLQLVDEQAAEEFQEGYELSYREVTFAEEGPDAGLEIKFDWEAPGGWIITRESPQKVCTAHTLISAVGLQHVSMLTSLEHTKNLGLLGSSGKQEIVYIH